MRYTYRYTVREILYFSEPPQFSILSLVYSREFTSCDSAHHDIPDYPVSLG